MSMATPLAISVAVAAGIGAVLAGVEAFSPAPRPRGAAAGRRRAPPSILCARAAPGRRAERRSGCTVLPGNGGGRSSAGNGGGGSRPRQLHLSSDGGFDGGDFGSSNEPRLLQFDAAKLLSIHDVDDEEVRRGALEALESILQRCYGSRERAGAEEGPGNSNIELECDGYYVNGDEIASIPDELAPFHRFMVASPRERDHTGCFRVFDSSSRRPKGDASTQSTRSLPPNALFSTDKPLTFLRDALSYKSEATTRKRGGMMCDGSEVVVWCGGEDEESLRYASRVFDDMPLAQLRLPRGIGSGGSWAARGGGGASVEGGDDDDERLLPVDLEAQAVEALESAGAITRGAGEEEDARHAVVRCRVRAGDLDAVQAVVLSRGSAILGRDRCRHNDEHRTSIETLAKLIDAAVKSIRNDPLGGSGEPHLVLIAHSVSASIVATAVEEWKEDEGARSRRPREGATRRYRHLTEDLLNRGVTVVTLGNARRTFPDGPAYVHVSMYDDPWTAALGCGGLRRPGENPEGANGDADGAASGGGGAVHLNAWSPYGPAAAAGNARAGPALRRGLRGHDAHNVNACLSQFLYLVMRINGLASFRALYDSARFVDPTSALDINPRHFAVNYGRHGDLVIPPRIDDELLPAAIRATGGDRWLWNAYGEEEDGGGSELSLSSVLPDEVEATSHLEESFGYSAFEELQETCCQQPN